MKTHNDKNIKEQSLDVLSENEISDIKNEVKTKSRQRNTQRKFVIVLSVFTVLATISLVLVNIFFDNRDNSEITIYYPGNTVGNTQVAEVSDNTESVNSTVASLDDTSIESEISGQDILDFDVVYWTPGGTVYHIEKSCLSRSTIIESGTIDDAKLAGKENLCKTCAKRLES